MVYIMDLQTLQEFVDSLLIDAERTVEWTINEEDKELALDLRSRLWRACDDIQQFIDERQP